MCVVRLGKEDTGGVASIDAYAHAMPFVLLSPSALGIALLFPSSHGHVLSMALVDMPWGEDVRNPYEQ